MSKLSKFLHDRWNLGTGDNKAASMPSFYSARPPVVPSSSFSTPAAPPMAPPGGAGAPSAGSGSGSGILSWLGNWLSGITPGDVLGAAGAGIGTYYDAKDAAAAIAEKKREFDATLKQRQAEFERQQAQTEGQLAVNAETALNKAPIADKAQALLLARMGHPTPAFHARDYTQGLNQISGKATGGPAASIAQSQADAAAYQPGQGGVKTDALQMLLNRMRGAGAPAGTAQTSTWAY